MTETFEQKNTIITQMREIPEKIHTVLRWHISAITCRIIMSTRQIFMLTRLIFIKILITSS